MVNKDFPFSSIEQYILKRGTLYLGSEYSAKEARVIQYTTIEELIEKIIEAQKHYCSYKAATASYECCPYGRRTITDLFRLCKYYNPDISLEQLYEGLITLLKNNVIYSWVCHSLHKRVYGYDNRWTSGLSSFPEDEFGFDFIKEGVGLSNTNYGDKQSTKTSLNIETYESNN